jgi:hypothetical protein
MFCSFADVFCFGLLADLLLLLTFRKILSRRFCSHFHKSVAAFVAQFPVIRRLRASVEALFWRPFGEFLAPIEA